MCLNEARKLNIKIKKKKDSNRINILKDQKNKKIMFKIMIGSTNKILKRVDIINLK